MPRSGHQSRRQLMRGLGLTALAVLGGCGSLPVPGTAAKVRRIGYLDPDTVSPNTEAFRQGLRDLGYVEGTNLLVEYRFAEGQSERLPSYAAELVGLPVEVLVAGNTPTAEVARRVTATIPIVTVSGNIVAAGLVSNIARPEGNVTGLTTNSVELVAKWVGLLKEALPSMTRLAALADPSFAVTGPHLRAAEQAAQILRLQLLPYDLPDLDDLPAVLASLSAAQPDGLLVLPGGAIRGGSDPRLGQQVLSARVPSISEVRDFAVNGGLFAYGTSPTGRARRAATYVDKLLKGAKPADLPVEQPATFDFVVNLKTAQALGLTIPRSVLEQAVDVIQ